MKTKIYFLIGWLIFMTACQKEETITKSLLDTNKPQLNNLDSWLENNFTTPYNIEVLYRWNENKTKLERYLHPPKLERVQPTMEAIKKIWLDSYKEVAGENFVKKIAPRELLLIGGRNLNPSGTITLGVAENGLRITFFNVDIVNLKDRTSLIEFIETIQHEYVHILNQNIPFDEESYQKITPSGYTGEWFNETTADSRELGYITNYARSNEIEDFAEMVTAMLSNTKAEYDAIINGISSSTAKANLRKKETFVVTYFKRNFAIDLYELQKVVADKTTEVLN